jgi:hypothetical protein
LEQYRTVSDYETSESLTAAGYSPTREEGDEDSIFSFLGVSITPNQATKMYAR